MNEHGAETEFKLTTPTYDELPKSRLEYLEDQVTELQNTIQEIKLIVYAIHNAGK